MGRSRIFFRRRCTRLLLYFNTNKPHSFFFCRIPVVLENRRSSRGGGCTPPAPSPRSALQLCKGRLEGLGTYNRTKKCCKTRYIAFLIKTLFEFDCFSKLQNIEFISVQARGGLITGCIVLFTSRWAYIHTYMFYLFEILYNKYYINYFQITKIANNTYGPMNKRGSGGRGGGRKYFL